MLDKQINKAAIYHRSSGRMCYALNSDDLVVRIRTGKEIDKVSLIWGDPYSAGFGAAMGRWVGESLDMTEKCELEDHIIWTAVVTPPYRRCRYYFRLHAGDESAFLYEDGIIDEYEAELSGKRLQYFMMPWMNPVDIDVTPDWVNETVWYQIFPDRFSRDSKASPREKGLAAWREGRVSNEEWFGGTLKGITEKLAYLNELGINGIYMTPICEAPAVHRYDTTDYLKIDPRFGTDKDMKEFVKKAHSFGIRVMMDGVFNHSGATFGPWKDVLKKGRDSKYADWFMVNEFPVEMGRGTEDGRFYSFAFIDNMPKLNTNNPEVCEFVENVCLSWIDKYDIDGIRFDVGNEVSHDLIRRLRKTLKNKKSDFFMLGEIWHDADQWLSGDEYDSTMNYPLLGAINDFFINERLSKKDFEYRINRCFARYKRQNNNVIFNMLDSHDTDRLMTRCDDQDIFIQQLAILFTMPGSVCIYYGTEIGLEGENDPDCRRCMPWDIVDSAVEAEKTVGSAKGSKVLDSSSDEKCDEMIAVRFHEVKELISLRKKHRAMRSPKIEYAESTDEPRCIEYIRYDEEGNAISVIINGSDHAISIEDTGKLLFEHLYNGKELAAKGTLIRLV